MGKRYSCCRIEDAVYCIVLDVDKAEHVLRKYGQRTFEQFSRILHAQSATVEELVDLRIVSVSSKGSAEDAGAYIRELSWRHAGICQFLCLLHDRPEVVREKIMITLGVCLRLSMPACSTP